jgi:NAD(P)-dependent dehydrogenase (short-subunit alcohol dehydrogenase family)
MKTQTVFITGTSTGIGRATATYFHEKGWNVVATMREPEKETEMKTGERLLVLRVDVTDVTMISEAFQKGIKKFGSIDVVVNNAGYGLLGPLELTTEAQVRDQFDTNVIGVINVSRIAIAHFRERQEGVIVNVSSMLGRITLPYMSIYAASKFAVEGLTEDLFYELSPFGIRVKLIEPGTIRTNFFTSSLVRAESSTVSAYDRNWHQVIGNLVSRGDAGEDPRKAAEVIFQASNDSGLRLRYKVDRLAKLLIFLRTISPLPLFQFIIKKTVK